MGNRAERQILIDRYGKQFQPKLDKMSDSQVHAIVMRLRSKGLVK